MGENAKIAKTPRNLGRPKWTEMGNHERLKRTPLFLLIQNGLLDAIKKRRPPGALTVRSAWYFTEIAFTEGRAIKAC